MTKKCSKCNLFLPSAMFNKANWLKSGLRPDCKTCYSALKKERWLMTSPKTKAAIRKRTLRAARENGVRICKTCELEKPYSLEFFAPAGPTRLQGECRLCGLERAKRWRLKNEGRAKVLGYAQCARRMASVLQRTPKWLSKALRDDTTKIYGECRSKRVETGIPYEVDHIYPLVGKHVSGLHVPWNLRIITRHENRVKSRRVIDAGTSDWIGE